ncbi:MAG: D-alanine--D-alanine ligase A [Legionellales bacterium RIFCSPHIGHO2_12_FULL_37_14]|nr:MAG: D-alanine--D-alanine ligase A [Legionellales bacterium RIFCSPHIGHO2_12_FULL_37_14]
MSTRLKVALLYGGPSGEHEISLRSAASVLANLSRDKYQVIPIGIDKSGCCYHTPIEEIQTYTESLPIKISTSEPLPGLNVNGHFVIDTDVVLPIVHGPLLEDGALQGILEFTKVAFVGSSVLSSAMCMDKDITRKLVSLLDVRFAKYLTLAASASIQEKHSFYENIFQHFQFPLFVKPCRMGSSVGISKVKTKEELEHAIVEAFRYDTDIIVEEGINGREIELAVLENSEPHLPPLVSVPGELIVNHPDGFYSYNAKYIESDKTALVIPADLPKDMVARLQEISAKVFTQLKCNGMARVDFFVNVSTNSIYFNEINTLPGFTSISMYPRLWNASGVEYSLLLDRLIQLALANHNLKQQLLRDYQ